MSNKIISCMSICFILLFIGAIPHSGTAIVPESNDLNMGKVKTTLKPDLDFGKFPLYFIVNKGQVNGKAAFYARTSLYTLWLTGEGLVFDSVRKAGNENMREVSRMNFVGARKDVSMVSQNHTGLKLNIFKGKDTSKWHKNVPTSSTVLYKNLYENIDFKVYGVEKQIEYDWIVKPGGNPGHVKFSYKNVLSSRIDKTGNLIVATRFGELTHKKPVSFQVNGQVKETVAVTYKKIGKNTFGFSVGKYDESRELIIDPVILSYSTYLGGSGAEEAHSLATDSSGFVYVAGATASTDFPTLDQYQADQTDWDVFLTKIDPTLSGAPSLLYSTYLGGSGADYAYGVTVDNSGIVYLTGDTLSTDFPTVGEYMTDPADTAMDIFISKLDTTQTGSPGLLYSTYFGGAALDSGRAITLDSLGMVYVTGYTSSADFPIQFAVQGDPADSADDAVMVRLDTSLTGAASLLHSTYLGGDGDDRGYGILVDDTFRVYITGDTWSTNFPTSTEKYQDYPGDTGMSNAFMSGIFLSNPSSIITYSTYLGGALNDYSRGIAVDNSAFIYLAGYTESTDFPTLGAYMVDPGDSDFDGFVSKLDVNQPGTSALLYSTYLGGAAADKVLSLDVDLNNYVYVAGSTSSTDFPIADSYMTDQTGEDAFFARLDTSQTGIAGIIYSSYLGGDNTDVGNAIATDEQGNVYVGGKTVSTNFPMINQYQGDQTGEDAFVSKFTPFPATVIIPNGGEEWALGSMQTLHWEAFLLREPLRISLWQNGLKLGNVALVDNPSGGSYIWTVGEYEGGTATPGSNFQIKIKEFNTKSLDESNNTFTILPTPPPSIQVLSPNGAEIWQQGMPQEITWVTGETTGLLKIKLYKDGLEAGTIAANLDPTTSTYSWNVGDYIGGIADPGTGYTVNIKFQGTAYEDTSDSTFVIDAPPPPTLVLLSPNGGEDLYQGGLQPITWGAINLSAPVRITLWKDAVKVGLIAEITDPAVMTYNWSVGEYDGGIAASGTGYTLLVKEVGTQVKDECDLPFGILDPLPPSITVLTPNGGEDFAIGSAQFISWNPVNLSDLIKITLYKDGVAIGTIVDDYDPTLGVYSWTVGDYIGGSVGVSSGYTIRIKEKGTAILDFSDSSFDISDTGRI